MIQDPRKSLSRAPEAPSPDDSEEELQEASAEVPQGSKVGVEVGPPKAHEETTRGITRNYKELKRMPMNYLDSTRIYKETKTS